MLAIKLHPGYRYWCTFRSREFQSYSHDWRPRCTRIVTTVPVQPARCRVHAFGQALLQTHLGSFLSGVRTLHTNLIELPLPLPSLVTLSL